MDTCGIAKPVQINDGLGIGIAWILQLQVCEVALGIAFYPFIETLLVAIYHLLILVQVEIPGGQDVVLVAIFLRFSNSVVALSPVVPTKALLVSFGE